MDESRASTSSDSRRKISPWPRTTGPISTQLGRFSARRLPEVDVELTDEERLKRLRKVLVGGRSTNPSALQKFIDQLEAEERNKNDNTDENLSISIKTVISCVENEVKSIDWANVKCEIDVDPVEKDVRSIIDSQLTSSDDSDNFFEKFMKELAQDNAKDTNISSVFQCKALEEFLTNDKSFGEESKVGDIKVENSSKEVRTSQRKKRVRTAFTGDADVIHKPKRRRKIPFEPSYMLPTPIPQEISPKIAIFSGGQKRKRRAKSPVFPVSNHLGKNMVKSELAVPGKRTIRPPKRFADYTTDLTDMVEQPKLGRPKKKQNSKEKLVYVKMDETIKTELDSTESPTCSSADQSSFEADQLITIKLEPIEDDVTPPLNPLLSVIRHDHNYRLKGAEVKKMPISRVLQIFKAMVTNKQISAELASHFFSAVRIQQQNLAVKKIVAEGWNEDDETPHFFDTVNPTKVSAMEFLQKVCPEMVMNVPTPLLIKQVLCVLCYLEVEGLSLAYKLQSAKAKQDQLLGRLIRTQSYAQNRKSFAGVLSSYDQPHQQVNSGWKNQTEKNTKEVLDNYQNFSARSRWANYFD